MVKIELVFYDAINPLSKRIFVRIGIFSHADGDPVLNQLIGVGT